MSSGEDGVPSTVAGSPDVQTVRVTEVGEYIRHHSCERRFKLEINRRRLARQLPFAERLFNPLDPVLQESGRAREEAWERSVQDGGLVDLTNYSARPDDEKPAPWSEVVAAAAGLPVGQSAYAREMVVSARVEAFNLEGRIDFVLLLWRDGRPVIRLVECKASRRDRTYYRVQVAIYRKLVRKLLVEDPSAIAANVEFVLDLNRSNVAFSRAESRLIVVCSDSLLDHIPAEVEHYDSAMLWKSLRAIRSRHVGAVSVEGYSGLASISSGAEAC